MKTLPISVIVPTKNNEKTICQCLVSIEKNKPAEIIIVDGKSTDKTLEIARKFTGKIFSDEGKGPCYAHQLGSELASQDYLAFIDADIVIKENTLSEMLLELKESGYANIQARWKGARRSTYWDRAQDWHTQIFQSRKGGGLSAALLRKDIVLSIGFDSSLRGEFAGFAGDDYDFLLRLKKKGYLIGNSRAIVYHYHRADFKSLVKRQFQFGRSAPYLMRKHGIFHAGLWPPLVAPFWMTMSVMKGKPWYLPYFFTSGVSLTAGFLRGFSELKGVNKVLSKSDTHLIRKQQVVRSLSGI